MKEPGRSGPDDVIEWLNHVAPDTVDDLKRLRRLVALLDRYYRERWERHVAVGDALIDRWERAQGLGFGEGTSIYDSALILGDVRIGKDTWVGPHTVLDGSGGLTIGDWCSISAGAQIYSHDSVGRALSGGKGQIERAATAIGSNTYVGPNAIVSRGVTIGSRCIVGAASLVLEDIPDGFVAYGVPARAVESSDEYLERRRDHSLEPGGL